MTLNHIYTAAENTFAFKTCDVRKLFEITVTFRKAFCSNPSGMLIQCAAVNIFTAHSMRKMYNVIPPRSNQLVVMRAQLHTVHVFSKYTAGTKENFGRPFYRTRWKQIFTCQRPQLWRQRTKTPSQRITKALSLSILENDLLICHLLAGMMETDCAAQTCQSIGQKREAVFHVLWPMVCIISTG